MRDVTAISGGEIVNDLCPSWENFQDGHMIAQVLTNLMAAEPINPLSQSASYSFSIFADHAFMFAVYLLTKVPSGSAIT